MSQSRIEEILVMLFPCKTRRVVIMDKKSFFLFPHLKERGKKTQTYLFENKPCEIFFQDGTCIL